MQWEKVLPDGLGDPQNDRIYFAPFYKSGLDDRLYISTWGPKSARGEFLSVRQGTWNREDVYPIIQPLSWKGAAVGLPSDTETNRPLEPQCIGPMTLGREFNERCESRKTLYVCAQSPIYKRGGAYAGDATVVYQCHPSLHPIPTGTEALVYWSVKAVLPGHVGDPEIIWSGRGYGKCLGKIFVSLRGATIGTNASGVWGIVGQKIGQDNPENEAVSSFYDSSDVLYAGTWGNRRQRSGAEIWKTKDGLTWELEHRFPDPAEWGITSMTEFRGNLYAGTLNHKTGTHIWRRENANEWRNVAPHWGEFNFPVRTRVLRSHGDTLYAGGGPPPFILTSKDAVNWDFDYTIGAADPNNYVIMGLDWCPLYTPGGPEALFAGVLNTHSGAQLWRYL